MARLALIPLLALSLLAGGCGSAAKPPPPIGLSSPLVVTVLGELQQLQVEAAQADQEIAADQIAFLSALKFARATPPQQVAGRMAAVNGALAAHQRVYDDDVAAYTRLDAAWKLLSGPLPTSRGLDFAARRKLQRAQRAAQLFVRREHASLLATLRANDTRLQRFIRSHGRNVR
jgi:hypothetical protein